MFFPSQAGSLTNLNVLCTHLCRWQAGLFLSMLWYLLQVQEQILEYASLKQNKDLKKGDGAKRGRVTGVASCTGLDHAFLL